RLERKLAKLEEKTEPVLHMPCRGDALFLERMELVETEAHRFSGGSDAEKLALMCAADLGANADSAGHLDHVVDSDLNVRKSAQDAANDGLDSLRSDTLSWCQRNVVPCGREHFIDKIRILVAERPVEGFHCLTLSAKALRKINAGCAHSQFLFQRLVIAV